MIEGTITPEGVPQIDIEIAGRRWNAVFDTGFNGYVELPVALKEPLNADNIGPIRSTLAAGQTIIDDAYVAQFPFDGEEVTVVATFVEGEDILIGTEMLKQHILHIDFPEKRLSLQRK